MITPRLSSQRGHFNFGWLDTYHTFSFGRYVDRNFMGFRSLRVINEDTVAPGAGFGEHPHDNMEIITYVLSGSLAHKDSTGGQEALRPGEVQRMSAGSGLTHSEFNGSKTEPVHLLQVWLLPEARDIEPSYEQRAFPPDHLRDRLGLIVSRDGAGGSLTINQDARLYASVLGAQKTVQLALAPGRHAWVQVARGKIVLNGTELAAGDGAAASNEPELRIGATTEAELLVFDLA
ncbi:MAG: pirin family protein [Phycisphaerales bacterium]|nr:pirin family protein [Phycisphaerales bacterium]